MRFKELRISKKLTQIELAGAMSVSQSAVAMWESGAAKPTADKLIKLSRILGCTVDQLLGGDDGGREDPAPTRDARESA